MDRRAGRVLAAAVLVLAAGQLRSDDPEIANVHVAAGDRSPLGAFLDALTEDYD